MKTVQTLIECDDEEIPAFIDVCFVFAKGRPVVTYKCITYDVEEVIDSNKKTKRMYYCKDCAGAVDITDIYCRTCGTKLIEHRSYNGLG